MASVSVKTASGASAGTVELDEAIFGIEPNVPVMHQVVTAQLAARRSGTQSTKTRAEVRGGGSKPWRQKGTGRARHGSIRSPQWRGGGVALGPKPRDYTQRTPKKMKRLALRSALSDRAADDKVIVVDDWGFEAPRTKDAVAKLEAIGASGRVLVVLAAPDEATYKSFRNLVDVNVITTDQLNTYDVLVSDVVVFTRDALPTDVARGSEGTQAVDSSTAGGTASAEGSDEPAGAAEPAEDGEAPSGSGDAGASDEAADLAAASDEEGESS